jgi:hypothetical protein
MNSIIGWMDRYPRMFPAILVAHTALLVSLLTTIAILSL